MLTGAIATIIFTRGVPCVIRFDVLEEEMLYLKEKKLRAGPYGTGSLVLAEARVGTLPGN